LLATISIQEAAAAGLNPRKIDEDMRQLLKGDTAAAAGRYLNALEHYRNAWRHAVHLHLKMVAQVPNGGLQLEFLALPGVKCAIQASTNLTDWETLDVLTAGPDGVVVLDDPNADRFKARFYRVTESP